MNEFDFGDLAGRMAFSAGLMFLTFNPTGHSCDHWMRDDVPSFTPFELVAGLVLLGLALGSGMSWAHIRRHAPAQASVDRAGK